MSLYETNFFLFGICLLSLYRIHDLFSIIAHVLSEKWTKSACVCFVELDKTHFLKCFSGIMLVFSSAVVVVELSCKQHLIELRAIGDTIRPSHDSANTKKKNNNKITAFVRVSIQRWNHRPAIKLKQTHRKKCERKRIEKKWWHYRVTLIVTTVKSVHTRIFDKNKMDQCRTHSAFFRCCYLVLKRDSKITSTGRILLWGQTFQTAKLRAKWMACTQSLDKIKYFQMNRLLNHFPVLCLFLLLFYSCVHIVAKEMNSSSIFVWLFHISRSPLIFHKHFEIGF